ncbi:extracellular solute-binding protein [Paenibacillus sp. MBLB2552]|uniref:Extracellular solute-binding protein n=1 Tax=Paenibacillus mellifer TaxID=2937794 RepID=A0A9X2BRK4_9BACL|nr:extracellular solute-binding protein [Paenibacillus mellifer]MCK8485721.1 extracellular solute-binding protein [Paenibacillus mellifer]
MSNQKTTSILLIWLLLLLGLSGCASNRTAGGGGTEGQPASAAGGNVTIQFMHLWPAGASPQQNKLVNEIIEQYQSEHPNITIQQEVLENEQYKNKLKILSAANELPDVGVTWAAGFMDPYVKGDLFAPLDDLLDRGLKDQFVPGATDAYAVQGRTYGLPIELNISPIYYNKAIFEKYHLEVPQTYDQFLDVIRTLNDNGVTPIALGNRDRWTGSMWYMYLADRLGGPETLKKAIDRSGTFEDPALIQAAAEIQKLVDMNAFIKGFNGLSNEEGKSVFLNEQAAMFLAGTWEVPNFTSNPDVPQNFKQNVGFFKFPTFAGGKGDINSWVGGPGVGLFVAENSKIKDEAKKFVEYFISKWGAESVSTAGVIPATKVDTSASDLPQLYIDLLDELNNASNLTLFADVQMKWNAAQTHLNMIQALFGEAVTPEQFVKEHEAALQKGD